ncbi:MAG: cytidine deaminase [Gemmatimonadetes bacterium]|nr:cytidine deaminase [Gemmatimonadota bacterium]NNM34795.1 cytidine deaminase [Gemmatimonadota bacterium]
MTDELTRVAQEAKVRAYAPYSGFRVGAALETETGQVFSGCNVENASYGLTQCAERVALGAAVAAGYRRFRRLVIVADGEGAVAPCGACRQVLGEFGAGVEVWSFGDEGKRHWALADLYPEPFSRMDLEGVRDGEQPGAGDPETMRPTS